MRLQQFLNENYDYLLKAKTFKKDYWFRVPKIFRNYKFFSGKNTTEPYFLEKVRQDRKPRDTYLFIHTYIDSIFKELYGIKFRSQSIFVTSNDKMAANFTSKPGSEIYDAYPIDKVDYLWSPKIEDFTEFLYAHHIEFEANGKLELLPFATLIKSMNPKWKPIRGRKRIYNYIQENKEEFHKLIRDEVKKLYKKNSGLEEAYKSGNEVMLHCKEAMFIKSIYYV